MDKQYAIYNKSSEDMSEVSDSTVDLILAGPPYNIGTTYSTNSDQKDSSSFNEMLSQIFAECSRVLNDSGKLIVECADTVFDSHTYTSLGALVQKIVLANRLGLAERHVSFTLTENGIEIPEHGWGDWFTTREAAHSNCHQLLVFSKTASFNDKTGKVLYYNYPANEEGHPCPFAPEMINFVLDQYLQEGQTVLDPFMGTGRLGRESLKRNCNFIGYELENKFYKTAEKYLEATIEEAKKEGNE